MTFNIGDTVKLNQAAIQNGIRSSGHPTGRIVRMLPINLHTHIITEPSLTHAQEGGIHKDWIELAETQSLDTTLGVKEDTKRKAKDEREKVLNAIPGYGTW